MQPTALEVLTCGLLKVAARARNLLAFGTGLVAMLVLPSWTAIAAILLGWTVLLAAQLKEPTMWREVRAELRRRPVLLPCATELTDQGAARHLRRLERARRERDRALACGPDQPSEATLALVETAGELEEQAVAQIRSLDRLGRYLDAPLVKEGLPAGSGAPFSAEPSDNPDLVWARAMIDQHSEGLRALAVMRGQLEVRLEALIETLAMLPCRVALMRMGERPDVMQPRDRDLRGELEAQASASAALCSVEIDLDL
jgi:hypothetical protein